jgi:hypothetical protein
LKGLLENLRVLDFCRFSKPGEYMLDKNKVLEDANKIYQNTSGKKIYSRQVMAILEALVDNINAEIKEINSKLGK